MATKTPNIPQGARSAEDADANRYSGLSRAVLDNPGFLPTTTTWESVIQQNREKEMQRIKFLEAQQAMRNAEQARLYQTGAPQPNEIFGWKVEGPVGNALISGAAGVANAIGGWLTSPAPNLPAENMIGPTGEPLVDPNAPKPQDNGLPPMSYRADVMGMAKGPERPGYQQVEVVSGGRQVGWRYVPADEAASISTDPNAQPVYGGPGYGMTEEERRRRTAERLTGNMVTEEGLDGRYEARMSDEDFNKLLGPKQNAAREAIYGTSVGTLDGRPIYGTDQLHFIGINKDLQALGYLPPARIPRPLPPDATEEQKAAYQKKLENAIKLPQYHIGQDWMEFNGKTVPQIREIQKMIRQAGGYKENQWISWGIAGEQEFKVMQDWMARANLSGVDWQRVAADDIAAHKAWAARKRAAGGGGGGSGPINTQTTITYSETSMAAGRTMLSQVLHEAMGRAPTNEELRQFMQMLNAAENKSPTRTVTNYVRGDGTMTSTSRTTPSDVDPQAMAREFAAQIGAGTEMLDYQATSYLDALMQTLMGAQNA